MSKVLIPFSGGINSTYALYKFLSETSHDITAVYAKESWVKLSFQDPWRQGREGRIADAKVDWLKSNVRDFTYEKVTDWPTMVDDIRPIRVGFTQTHNYGIQVAIYKGYANLIELHSPDILVTGNSLENTASDCHPECRDLFWKDDLTVIYAGTPDLTPTPKEPYDYDAVAATMIGRFEQLESIPAELHAISNVECDCDIAEDMKFTCLICGFDLSRKKLSDLSGAEVDDIFAKHGSYGKYRSEADPETYTYRGNPYDKFGEILGRPEGFE